MALAVKKVCRLAYREGLTERQLFAHIETERGENKQPRALDRASLDKLLGLTFEPYEVELETARNLFLFSCYTGVAYCDMVALNREHLFTDDEGALWLKFRRQKTDMLCRVKLLSETVRMIERYQSEERNTIFAPIAYSAYLVQLKALQLRAGISIPLSAHVGRHTFATLITLERGVPIEAVSRMLGHSSIQTTERYAHVTPKKLFDEFERFLSFTEDLQLSLWLSRICPQKHLSFSEKAIKLLPESLGALRGKVITIHTADEKIMRSTFKILFYINKSKTKTDGTTAILCRITIDGSNVVMFTGEITYELFNTTFIEYYLWNESRIL